jgi:hypothetical protein
MTKVVFRGYNRVKFQSLKLGKTVFCQSLLLRDYLLHLEWDATVSTYELNPFKIIYKFEGKKRIFSPHLLITRLADQPCIVWLKSSPDDKEESSQKSVKLINEICSRNNYYFEIKTPGQIRKEPLFSNLKLLRRYSRNEITINQIVLCNDFFSRNRLPFLSNLIEFFERRNELAQAAYALLAQKIVTADFDSELINDDLSLQLVNSLPSFVNGRLVK